MNIRFTGGTLRYENDSGESWAWPVYMAAPIQDALVDAILPALPDFPHEASLDTRDYVVRIDGRAITPDDDASEEAAEVRAFLDAIYGAQRDSEQAENWRLLQAEAPAEVVEPLTPEQEQKRQKALIVLAFEQEMAAIESQYTALERETWHQQKDEANAWQAWADGGQQGPEPATIFIDAMIAENGIPKADMVGRIRANVQAFAALSGAALGKMQRRKAMLGE